MLTKMVDKPKPKVTMSQINTSLSRQVVFAAKRSHFRRRCSKMIKPTIAVVPKMPPITIAKICLAPWETPIASQNHKGVSSPNKCPKNTAKTPT